MSSMISNSTRYIDMPYLEAEFRKESVHICELHCGSSESKYENKGYGTMLIDVLIQLAKKSNCKYIAGKLSFVDAKKTRRKIKEMVFTKKGDLH